MNDVEQHQLQAAANFQIKASSTGCESFSELLRSIPTIAFDTIDHWILLNRLSCSFGISGTVLSWVQSYLTGRSYSVCIGLLASAVTCCTVYPRDRSSAPCFSQFTHLQFPQSVSHTSSLSSSMQTTPNFSFRNHLTPPQNTTSVLPSLPSDT